MYIGHRRLCVCVFVPRRIPTLVHGPECKLAKLYGVPSSCALLGGIAIGARVRNCYDNIAPNGKCQRMLVLALRLVLVSFR